jgi:hypothetical protein
MKEAKEIFEWVINEVMPSLRKHGEYRLSKSSKKEIDLLNKEIETLRDELKVKGDRIDVLEHNMKTTKYDKGGSVYICRPIFNTMDFNVSDEVEVKFGKTINLNSRKKSLSTSLVNKMQYIKVIYLKDKNIVEACLKNKMSNYLVQAEKEYVKCSYSVLIDELALCIKFFEGYDIDKTPDIFKKESRLSKNEEFDVDIDMKFVFTNEYDYDTEEYSDEDNFLDISDSAEKIQTGAGQYEDKIMYKIMRLKYEIKGLLLLDDLR